jgi:RNA polymerase sigma-70 factor (ECF subfamily)
MLGFQELYESYAIEVFRFAYWLSGDSVEAEDITSETFVRAWTSTSRIRTETLKAYLFTIARNTYLEQLRKRKREVILDDGQPDPVPGPEPQIESRLRLLVVRSELQNFPEIDRSAFVLRVQHDLPYEEIARILDLSLSATKVKVHRVRKKLIIACLDQEDK